MERQLIAPGSYESISGRKHNTDAVIEYAIEHGFNAEEAAEFAEKYIDNQAWLYVGDSYADALYDFQNSTGLFAPRVEPDYYSKLLFEDDDGSDEEETKYVKPVDAHDETVYRYGAQFSGIKQIVEYEDDFVYIPDSYYCGIKCIEKALDISTDKVKASQFGNSSTAIFKYFEERGYNRKNLPAIYKWDDDTNNWVKMNKHHATDSTFALVAIRIIREDYHMCMVKNRENIFKRSGPKITHDYIANRIRYQESKTLVDDWICNSSYEPKEIKSRHCIFYDIETYSQKVFAVPANRAETNDHNYYYVHSKLIPYSVAWAYEFMQKDVDETVFDKIVDSVEMFEGDDCMDKFLDSVIKFCNDKKITDVTVFAHNGGGFDHHFLYKNKTLKFESDISAGTRIKCLTCSRNGVKMHLLDSWAFLQLSLKESCKSLRIDPKYCKIDDFDIVGWSKEKYMNPLNRGWVDYLKYDVVSLAVCMLTFNKLFESEYSVCALAGVGISSLAYKIMNKTCNLLSDCYLAKDLVTEKFIRSACYGGRVLHWKNMFVSQFEDDPNDPLISGDGNSLYPSAMEAFAYPCGMPVVFNESEISVDLINEWNAKGFMYIAEIEFDTGNQRYPIIPWKDENGTLLYKCGVMRGTYSSVMILEMIAEGYTITKAFRGIKWPKSAKIFSPFIGNTYEMRKKYKAMGNSFEYVLKILLNSCYGKFFQDIDEFIKFSNEMPTKASDLRCKKILQLPNGQYKMTYRNERKCSKNPAYLAVFILDYSKKIMNNYMRMIGKQNIYYSDTDSIYCKLSAFKDSGIVESNDICGIKNDYTDKYIENAYFLDQKRYLLLFTDGTCKAKFNGLSFKSKGYDKESMLANYYEIDEGTKLSQEDGTEVMEKDFKGRGFLVMEQLFLDFINNPQFDLSLAQEKWSRQFNNIQIDYNEVKYIVNPSRRGNWETDVVIRTETRCNPINGKQVYKNDLPITCAYRYKIFYPFGYDKTKPEVIGPAYQEGVSRQLQIAPPSAVNYRIGPFRMQGNVPPSSKKTKEILKKDMVEKLGIDISRINTYEGFFKTAEGDMVRLLKGKYYFVDKYGISKRLDAEEENLLKMTEYATDKLRSMVLTVGKELNYCSEMFDKERVDKLITNLCEQLKSDTKKTMDKK